MWARRGGEDASWQPQCLSGTFKVSEGGAPCDRHHKPWADRPGTEFHAKMEVPSGGKIGVEDVERGDTYLGTGGIHTREETDISLQHNH